MWTAGGAKPPAQQFGRRPPAALEGSGHRHARVLTGLAGKIKAAAALWPPIKGAGALRLAEGGRRVATAHPLAIRPIATFAGNESRSQPSERRAWEIPGELAQQEVRRALVAERCERRRVRAGCKARREPPIMSTWRILCAALGQEGSRAEVFEPYFRNHVPRTARRDERMDRWCGWRAEVFPRRRFEMQQQLVRGRHPD